MSEREVKRWAVKEFNYPASKLPPDRCLRKFCAGQRSAVWKYVTQRVFKEKKVEIRRKNINWYQRLEDDQLKRAEALRRQELQREMKELKDQIIKQDLSIREAEEDLQKTEWACSVSWSQHEECSQRELLLWSFLQRCGDVRRGLMKDTQPIREQRQALEEHLSKGEEGLCFDMSGGGDGLNVEPLVMHEVRKLCEDRVQFLRAVLADASANTEAFPHSATPAEREAVREAWREAVQAFLQTHPPSHVLSAFFVLAQQQQSSHSRLAKHRSLEEQSEEESRPSLKTLVQAAWVEAEQAVVELAQTRSRTQELRNHIRVLLNEAMMLLDEDHRTQAALSQGLQRVLAVAEGRSLVEQCAQMEAQTAQVETDTHHLRQQQKSIMGLRKTVAGRQEVVRDLITGISLSQSQLLHLHSEIRQFLKADLFPLYEKVIKLTASFCNYVSMETHQFASVPMLALDCRELDGDQKVPACQLSIYRIGSPRFFKLCKRLEFPMYKTPVELLSHAALQCVALRRHRNALLLLSSSTAAIRKAATQLPAPDCNALLEMVRRVDEGLQGELLPRASEVLHHCNQGLDSCSQVRTAITHWWEQPAQFALPEVCVEGRSFLQWLYRWQCAAKRHQV